MDKNSNIKSRMKKILALVPKNHEDEPDMMINDRELLQYADEVIEVLTENSNSYSNRTLEQIISQDLENEDLVIELESQGPVKELENQDPVIELETQDSVIELENQDPVKELEENKENVLEQREISENESLYNSSEENYSSDDSEEEYVVTRKKRKQILKNKLQNQQKEKTREENIQAGNIITEEEIITGEDTVDMEGIIGDEGTRKAKKVNKRTLAKRLREEGKEYLSSKGKVVNAMFCNLLSDFTKYLTNN